MYNKENWDEHYRSGNAPWNSDKPTRGLIDLVDSGKIKPCKVLELGCGTGTNAIYLISRGFSVTAIDIAKTALIEAKEKARKTNVSIDLVNSDILYFYSKTKYGFILDIGCFHYIEPQDRSIYIKNLEHHLKSDGKYYLNCFPFAISSCSPYGFAKSQIENCFSNFKILEAIKSSPYNFDNYLDSYLLKKKTSS